MYFCAAKSHFYKWHKVTNFLVQLQKNQEVSSIHTCSEFSWHSNRSFTINHILFLFQFSPNLLFSIIPLHLSYWKSGTQFLNYLLLDSLSINLFLWVVFFRQHPGDNTKLPDHQFWMHRSAHEINSNSENCYFLFLPFQILLTLTDSSYHPHVCMYLHIFELSTILPSRICQHVYFLQSIVFVSVEAVRYLKPMVEKLFDCYLTFTLIFFRLLVL